MTLGLVLEKDQILLGMKKAGFGAGRWNGFGGKVQGGETVEAAMVRECEEECGIKVTKYEQVGQIDFNVMFKGNREILSTHFFRILEYSGTPTETEEMKPQWFKTNEIPYKSMWADDSYWMPIFLRGKKFNGNIKFDEKDIMLENNIKEVEKL